MTLIYVCDYYDSILMVDISAYYVSYLNKIHGNQMKPKRQEKNVIHPHSREFG